MSNTEREVGYDPEAENIGKYILSFIESTGKVSSVFERKVREIFEEQLGELRADEWYRVEDVATAFETVDDEIGSKTMEEGGREAALEIPFPDDLGGIDEVMEFTQEAHRDSYRKSPQLNPGGNYTFEREGDRTARVGITVGFPTGPGFGKGVLGQLIRDFGPPDATPQFETIDTRDHEKAAWEVSW